MGKALGGFLRLCFSLALLAAMGYNTWQVLQLRAEVEALKRARGIAPSRPGVADSLRQLGEARRHAERAQALLKARRFSEAREEIARAAEASQAAHSGLSAGAPTLSLAELQKTVNALSAQAGALWEREERTGGKERR